MSPQCHRCGSEIESEDSFCATCGAPQLRLPAIEEDDEQTGNSAEGQSEARSYVRVNPLHAGDVRKVDWKRAFRAALTVALPVGVLTALPGVSIGFLLWVVGGAVLVIATYRRRRPGAMLDARSGFRIGALTGLLSAYISAFLVATLQLLARYQFNLGPTMDREYAEVEEQSMHWAYQLVQSSAETEAQMRAYLHFLLSPDGRAAASLANAVTKTVFMVVLAGLGGLLGVRMFARRAA